MEDRGLIENDLKKKKILEQSLMKLNDEQFLHQHKIVSQMQVKKVEEVQQTSGREKIANLMKDGALEVPVMQSEVKIPQSESEELLEFVAKSFEDAPDWEEVKKKAYDKPGKNA